MLNDQVCFRNKKKTSKYNKNRIESASVRGSSKKEDMCF